MDTSTPLVRLEAALTSHLTLIGDDPAVGSAGRALLSALEPAMKQAVIDLAEQAAHEVAAQLAGHQVNVVMRDGEPSLMVTADETTDPIATDEDYEARISLRLPPTLKQLIEDSAGETGDSVNSWLVKAVSSRVKVKNQAGGTRVTGTIDT